MTKSLFDQFQEGTKRLHETCNNQRELIKNKLSTGKINKVKFDELIQEVDSIEKSCLASCDFNFAFFIEMN